MISTDAMPPKAKRYQCRECGIASPAPIVKPIANPKHELDGRCSNRDACARRKLRADNRAKAPR